MHACPVLVRRAALLALVFLIAPFAAPAQTEKIRSLKIVVRDAATDAPIEGVELNAYALLRDMTKPEEAGDSRQFTNAAGEAVFSVPPRETMPELERTFSIRAKHARYASRAVNFVAEGGRVRDTLPESHTLRLKPGLTVGGQVLDERAKPLAGVKLVLYGSDYRGMRTGSGTVETQEYPEISIDAKDAIITDAEGRWQLENFPTDLTRLQLYVTRPGGGFAQFATSDDRFGSRPGVGEIRTLDLHARKAVLTLKDGVTVRGIVTDAEGHPLIGAKLRARDATQRGPLSLHTLEVGPDGRFELPHWSAQSAILTAERDGFATKSITVPLSADMPEARIALPAAKALVLRAVDDTGAPLDGAEVRIVDYRSGSQLLDWKGTTDAEGRVTWLGAPDEAVTYSIGKRPNTYRTVKLVADGTEHLVRIRRGAETQIFVEARVTDAATGEVIPSFEVWRRMASQPSKLWGAPAAGGVFKGEVRMDEVPRGWAPSYRLEVRAPGYATWTSDTIDLYEGDQTLAIKLSKGAARRPANARVAASLDTDPTLAQIAEPVTQLAQAGDVAAFVSALTVSLDDMKALVPAGKDKDGADVGLGNNPQRSLERRAQALNLSARRFVDLAEALGIGGGKVRFTVKSATAGTSGSSGFVIAGERVNVPALFGVRIVLTGVPAAGGSAALAGDYEIETAIVRKFPSGWRLDDGLRWIAVPSGVGTEAQRRQIDLESKIGGNVPSSDQRALSGPDDEALVKLGDTVIAFLRSRSSADFIAATTITVAEAGALAERNGNSAASAAEWQEQMLTALGSVTHGLIDQLDRLGIDLSTARITLRNMAAERPTFTRFGIADSIRASPVRITLAVESEAKAKNGASIAGDYVLTLGQAVRVNNRWVLGDDKLRWQQIPPAVVGADDKKQLEFENYVAENRTLPPGTPAPEIEMVKFAGDARVKLSDYRGKIVVLEFWASWCGPCQEPMTKLQALREHHPEWGDRVEIIAVSIDDTLVQATEHAAKKEWAKTFNTWAGEGGFKSAPPQAFRVRGIPTAYVIDAAGKIVRGGHPMSLDFGAVVSGLLK